MSIQATSDKVNNSIPKIPLNLRLETVDAASKAYFHTTSTIIRTEMLLVIETALPADYAKYTTSQGIVVERVSGSDPRFPTEKSLLPHICLHVEQRCGPDHRCPSCKLDLLNEDHGEIVDSYGCDGGLALVAMCRHCWQFWVIRK
jgi:hypothetical protein